MSINCCSVVLVTPCSVTTSFSQRRARAVAVDADDGIAAALRNTDELGQRTGISRVARVSQQILEVEHIAA